MDRLNQNRRSNISPSESSNLDNSAESNTQGIVEEFWKIVLADNGNHTLQFFDKLLASNQNDANAWLNRGVLLEKIGNSSEAIESFTKAIQVGSGNDLWMAFLGRTLIYYNLKNFHKSLDDCDGSAQGPERRRGRLQSLAGKPRRKKARRGGDRRHPGG